MTLSRDTVLEALRAVRLPDGGNIVDAEMVRALSVEGGQVRFVIEVDPAQGAGMEPVRAAADAAVKALPGVAAVNSVLTAHSAPAQKGQEPPSLKVGRHPTAQEGPADVAGVRSIIAVGSGKGGVGKSTVAANLAVALSQAGKSVGLLDADVYGPSQPRMMGISDRPESPDGKLIIPLVNHGVRMMSIGLMVKEGEAVVWRGPMLAGALQQMMSQVDWGNLDVLIVDLPPGTGDVQLTLSQKFSITGAILVSTPQDVALLDARKALNMFDKTGTPVLGLIENMSAYICPKCGNEEHIFGHGGTRADAARNDLPFLGEVPLDISIRISGDEGTPVVVSHPESREAEAFSAIARHLIEAGSV